MFGLHLKIIFVDHLPRAVPVQDQEVDQGAELEVEVKVQIRIVEMLLCWTYVFSFLGMRYNNSKDGHMDFPICTGITIWNLKSIRQF